MRILFLGTPAFAVPSLEALIEAGYRPAAVVTAPDRPGGRGMALRSPAVKQAALRHDIPIIQPESLDDPALRAEIAALAPDVMVVVAFRILPEALYSIASRGAFNLHASILPAFRGAAPIQRALMAGVAETGVTTFFLRPRVDTGDVILTRRIAVGPDETGGELHDRLAVLGAGTVVDTVRLIDRGEVRTTAQDDSLATPAPKIFRGDARIDWGRPARAVHDHIRALSPHPGSWTTTSEGVELKILRSSVEVEMGELGRAGEVMEAGDRLVVAAGQGAIEVLELQREGRARMSANDFLRGSAIEAGAPLR